MKYPVLFYYKLLTKAEFSKNCIVNFIWRRWERINCILKSFI